jgi:uncharacterized protein (DUF3820 family)
MKRTPENLEQFTFKQLEGSSKDAYKQPNKLADAMTDEDVMTFGKHKGMKLLDVPDSYLLWLYETDWCKTSNPRLYAYIYNCLGALDVEKKLYGPKKEYSGMEEFPEHY